MSTAPAEISKFNASTTTDQVVAALAGENHKGQLALVTGGYSGLGAETVRALLAAGMRVVVAGRSAELLDRFVKQMNEEFPAGDGEPRAMGLPLDLADLTSVRQFADAFAGKFETLDLLVNNAGVMNTPKGATAQGFETQWGVNVIGHFLLTKLLLDKLRDGRVIFLSSVGHAIHGAANLNLDYYRTYDPQSSEYNGWVQYQQSKLGDLLLAKAFAKRYGLTTAALHPGFINTRLNRHATLSTLLAFLFKNFSRVELPKSTKQGAATTVLCSLLPEADLQVGGYYADCQIAIPHACAQRESDLDALLDYCEDVTAAFQPG